MQEIEIKLIDIDPLDFQARVEALGARLHFESELHAVFYDYPDGRIRARRDVLRLRREGEETCLTYKKFISKEKAKIMEELETKVADMETLQQILAATGLEIIKETRKTRTEWVYEDTKLLIDRYHDALSFIPAFAEVEAPTLERLHEIVKMLGFNPEDCKHWDTQDLVNHYRI